MNLTIPQFQEFCTELTKKEVAAFENYLDVYCPKLGSTDGIPAAGYKNYLYRLYWFASRSGAKNIVELGARPGGSTMALLFALERNDGHLWSCDLATIDSDQMSKLGVNDSRRTTVSHCRADDYGKAWSLEGRGKVDMIYLDTSHEYPDTVAEINAWLPNLKEGGFFIFHDTDVYKSGVLKPIIEAIVKFDRLFEFHAFPDCHGHGVLQWYSPQNVPYSEPGTKVLNNDKNIISLTSMLLNEKK